MIWPISWQSDGKMPEQAGSEMSEPRVLTQQQPSDLRKAACVRLKFRLFCIHHLMPKTRARLISKHSVCSKNKIYLRRSVHFVGTVCAANGTSEKLQPPTMRTPEEQLGNQANLTLTSVNQSGSAVSGLLIFPFLLLAPASSMGCETRN
jgi:hypothetical protein